MFRDAVPVLVAILLAWYLGPSPRLTSANTSVSMLGPAAVKEYEQRIIQSNEFLTALQETLPKGAHDEKDGLDYVPFMLANIRDRRLRHNRASHLALWCTVLLGIIFSGIVMYFGYVLVNEAAIGTQAARAAPNRGIGGEDRS
jgi:hypothetical protein